MITIINSGLKKHLSPIWISGKKVSTAVQVSQMLKKAMLLSTETWNGLRITSKNLYCSIHVDYNVIYTFTIILYSQIIYRASSVPLQYSWTTPPSKSSSRTPRLFVLSIHSAEVH